MNLSDSEMKDEEDRASVAVAQTIIPQDDTEMKIEDAPNEVEMQYLNNNYNLGTVSKLWLIFKHLFFRQCLICM